MTLLTIHISLFLPFFFFSTLLNLFIPLRPSHCFTKAGWCIGIQISTMFGRGNSFNLQGTTKWKKMKTEGVWLRQQNLINGGKDIRPKSSDDDAETFHLLCKLSFFIFFKAHTSFYLMQSLTGVVRERHPERRTEWEVHRISSNRISDDDNKSL